MIPSLDTFVYTQIKNNLKAILSHPRIINEALAMIDEEARENFIKAYCGKDAKKEVGVSYVFPQAKENFDARIVVQLGNAQEESMSLGAVEGTFTYRELGDKEEATVVQPSEDNRLFIETEHTIGTYDGTDNLSFSDSDDVNIIDNRIYFNREGNEHLIGLPLTVYYTAKEPLGKDPKGVQKGYSSRDIVEVVPLSTNMDTARCLDAIMKVVLIIMLEDREAKTTYNLQTANFEAMQLVVSDTDRLVFGRPLTLSYTVSYSIDFDFTKEIKEIIIRGVK